MVNIMYMDEIKKEDKRRKEHAAKRAKEYRQRPEVKAHNAEYRRKYTKQPQVRLYKERERIATSIYKEDEMRAQGLSEFCRYTDPNKKALDEERALTRKEYLKAYRQTPGYKLYRSRVLQSDKIHANDCEPVDMELLKKYAVNF